MDPMAPSFLIVSCACHAQPRLGVRALVDDALIWTCQACAAPIDLDRTTHEWVQADALDVLGYDVEGFAPKPKHGGSGCRDGQCGVRQPEPH